MNTVNRLFEAYLDEMNRITILMPKAYHNGNSEAFVISTNERSTELEILQKIKMEKFVKYICKVPFEVDLGLTYLVTDTHGGKTDLQIGSIIRTPAFDEAYFYDGEDLGVTYATSGSTFKVWAPTATDVLLKLIYPVDNDIVTIQMVRKDKGVWSTHVGENLEGVFYSYLVCVNLIWREAIDPYVSAVSINSEYGVVIDLQKTKQRKVHLPPLKQATDAIIYETHIRDFSIHRDSGISQKGKYVGLTERNTTGPNGTTTGLSYLVDLGITHVEFLPFNDFYGVNEENSENEYNWGYNPLFFNAPEGSYATNPKDPYNRINELKSAITALHENGLRVIMDVVYNHVYIREESSFEKIVPGYYFRHDEHGMPSNGTGVGNDIASERKMVKKFIKDSVSFWLNEYHVDGFRFDLMGILDIDTMNEIRTTVNEIDPTILLFGEGWDLNTPLPGDKKAIIRNAAIMPGIAQFNDRFRDGIKGSTFNLYDRGFALGNSHKEIEVKQSIAGSVSLKKGEKGLFTEPTQTINYIESHDNHTLWDKMMVCNAHENDEIRRRRQRLATTMVLLSQGIPFLHSGQEFYRTKKGVENSYKSPDSINELDWKRKFVYLKDVEYLKGIVRIRRYHEAFRLSNAALIRKHLRFYPSPEGIITYTLTNVCGPWNTICVIHNNQDKEVEIKVPYNGLWQLVCYKDMAGIETIDEHEEPKIVIAPISTIVMYQK